MLEILSFKNSNKLIATIAIGDEYLSKWNAHAKNSWLAYCAKYQISLYVFDRDLIGQDHKKWKKATWQKFLIGDELKKNGISSNVSVCYLDTDIIISPFAPDIFEHYDQEKLGLISMFNNMPYFSREDVLRKIAFHRNRYYSSDYPLFSSLFMAPQELYSYHSLPPQSDFACAGVFLFNIKKHGDFLKNTFIKYPRDVASITSNGDQTHLNYEFQANYPIHWIDYRFQALWVYEMAAFYPFLYKRENQKNIKLISDCINSSLTNCYFLHFAGSWYESDMWTQRQDYDACQREEISKYIEYKKNKVDSSPVGIVKPLKKKSNEVD